MGTSEMRFGGGVPEVDHDAQQGNKGFQSVVVEEELREHVQWSQPQPPQRMSLYPWFVPFEPANDPFEFEDTLPPYNFAPNPLFGYETKSTYANEAPFGAEVSIPHVVGEKVPLKKLEAISRTKQRQRPEQGVALVSPADSISLKQLVGFHDVKQRQKQELDNKVVMLETPSPKTAASPPVEATRLKLRESLTSALQIVDSSQIGNAELDAKADGISDGNAHSNELKRMKQSEKGDIDMVGFDEAARQVGSDAPQLEVGGAVGKDIGKDMSGPDDEVKLEIDLSAADAVDSTSKGSDVEMKDGHSENIMAEVELLQQRVVEQARKVAVSIESQLFILFGGVNKKYREKARSLLFNLKDKSNPELRARVFSGEITPEALCSMTAEDLASKELSEWRTAKAEELSHAVVLTDADVDPRFIVKKTHKGEFQVEVEKDVMDVLPPPELTANRSSQTKAVSKEAIELVKEVEDLQPQEQEQLEPDPEPEFDIQQQQQADLQQENIVGMDSPTPVADGGVVADDKEMVTDMVDGDSTPEVALDPNLPAIPSMDDFQESRDASRDPVVEEKVVEKISKEEVDKTVQPAAPELVWQGNLQTNTSKLTPIRVFFRSGDKADLSEWSKLIEVKGRVRLAALTKFLQELQSSRSRSVMVLSICKQEEQDGGSSTSNLLTEVAEQYRTGERVGYAEPSPGFELYLLPPGNDTTKLLAEHGHPQDSSDVIGEGEELLMGVVVWRKNQTQSSVPSRGPNQNKRVGFSGKSSVSPSTSEAPKSGLTSSRKGSASSAAHVSHGLSMQKHIESDSSTRTPVRDSFRHSPSVTNSVNYQQQPVAPLAGVKGAEERSAGLSKESSLASRQQTSLPSRRANHDNDLADVPPGFFPVPSPFAPDAASRGQSGSSTGAALTSAVPSPLSKLSSHGDPRVLSQLVPAKKDEEMVEAPPGFWPRGPQALRPPSPTDEDDLPEFDFGSGSSQRGMLGTGQQVVSGSAELALKNSLNPESAPNQFGVEVPKEQSLLNSGVPVYPHPTSRFYNDLHNARDYTSPSPAGGAYNLQQTPAAAAASVYSQQGLGSGLDQRFLGNQQQSAVNLSSLPLAQDLSYLNASGRRDYPAESLARQGQMDSAESLMSRAGTHLPNVGGQSFGVTDATALQYARGGMLNQQLRAGPLPEWRPQVAPGVATYQAPRPAMSMMNNTNPGVFAAQQQQRFSAVVQARSALPADPSWARGPAPQQLLPDAAAASRAAPGTAPAVGPVGAQVGAGVGGVGMPKWQHPNQFQRTIYATRKPVEIKDTAAALRQREILNARDAYPGRSGDPYSANSTRSRDPRKHRRDRSRSRDRGRGRSRERSRSRDRGRSRSKDRHRQKDKDKETGRGRERERERSGDRSRGRSRSRSRSRGRSRERSRERSKEKSTERNRERSRERERDRSASPKNSK